MNRLFKALAALTFLLTPAAHAAAAAGAIIEINGKAIAGYTITHNNESRQALYDGLPSHDLTFERDFKVPVDAKDKTQATLRGIIRIHTKIAGEQQLMASASSLQLVKVDGKWKVTQESLGRALKVSAPAQPKPEKKRDPVKKRRKK
jgi:hypothetical protein